MKKGLLFLMFLTGITLVFFNSCTKCDEDDTSQTFKTAVIKGKAFANLDMTNDTNDNGSYEIKWEKVPAGTKIFAKINTEDLDPSPDYNSEYQDILFETTVDDNGEYEISVYAGAKTVNVAIKSDDFQYNTKINETTYEMRVYSLPATLMTVISDQVKYKDMYFQAN